MAYIYNHNQLSPIRKAEHFFTDGISTAPIAPIFRRSRPE